MLGCEVPMRHAAFFSVAITLMTSSVVASPNSAPKMVTARVVANAAALRFGKSVGSPTDGHLVGGAHLDDTSYVKVMAHDAPGDVRWGLSPLVGMIDRAAKAVSKKFPGSVLEVGHLSRSGGGDVGDHASHESGRDADLAFYAKNSEGKQVFSDNMVKFAGDGTASAWPGAHFDDARNWMLVSSIVQDNANVTHIFVSTPLRARLLAYAAKIGAPESVRTRAAELMMQPHGSLPHDDHFHVRIGCPAGQRECVENPAPKKKLHITHVPTPKRRERTEPAVHGSDHRKTDAPVETEPQPTKSSTDDSPQNKGDSDSSPGSNQDSDETPNSSAVLAAPNDPVEGD